MNRCVFVMIMVAMSSLLPHYAQAAPPASAPEGELYVVQADDWLSKIAEKFYGDMFAYPSIVAATNAKAMEDDTFTVIENPDVIEIGQKLWIPIPSEVAVPPGFRTEVIVYVPPVPTKMVDGHCWTSSIAAPGSPYAWRCSVENTIYDPCLTAVDGQTIVCGVPDQEFGLNLTEPLPKPEVVEQTVVRPWLLELTDGVTCSPFTGTLPPIKEQATYGCSDQAVILDDLQPGLVWYAQKAILEPTDKGPLPFQVGQEKLVPVAKVWLPGEPETAGR